MLLYLTSNQKSGLIDGVTREMLMPSKKLVGKFSLKSFVTKDMRNYATAKFFLIDAACIEESGRGLRPRSAFLPDDVFCPYHRNPVRL